MNSSIKEIEKHISRKSKGYSNILLDNVKVPLTNDGRALDILKDIYSDSGVSENFAREYQSYTRWLANNDHTYRSKFFRTLGIPGPLKYDHPLKKYPLKHHNFSEDIYNCKVEDLLDCSRSILFKLSLGRVDKDILNVVDSLAHLVIAKSLTDYRDNRSEMSLGFSGFRTKEYGGDLFTQLSYAPGGLVPPGVDLIKSTFDKYQFDITLVVTPLGRQGIKRVSSNEYVGNYLCTSVRYFNSFSDRIISPLTYMKPIRVLYRSDSSLDIQETNWVEVPTINASEYSGIIYGCC